MKKRVLMIVGLSMLLLAQATLTTSQTPTATIPPADGLEGELQQIPILPEITDPIREIYEHGQVLGNDPHVFSKVGDSNTAHPRFLTQIDAGNYDLGAYEYLQLTVDFFAGSFGRPSYAAYGGFNFATVLDPFLADPQVCEANETPLECEYRVNHTSVAFFMFGSNDLLDLKPERYTDSMRRIIEISLEHGVIPVFTTYIRAERDYLWDKTLEFNMIMVEMAAEYHVPVINLWLAAQSLPHNGIDYDTMHLSYDKVMVSFNGEEALYGHDLRNLLTLLMLDALRTEIPMGSQEK